MCDLQREESRSLVEELRLQLAYKERELQVMREGAEELNALRQQNYLLQSKVRKHSRDRAKQLFAFLSLFILVCQVNG